MHILVVDDSKVMRSIVTRTLRQAGFDSYDIKEADNGRAGLDAALAEPPSASACSSVSSERSAHLRRAGLISIPRRSRTSSGVIAPYVSAGAGIARLTPSVTVNTAGKVLTVFGDDALSDSTKSSTYQATWCTVPVATF